MADRRKWTRRSSDSPQSQNRRSGDRPQLQNLSQELARLQQQIQTMQSGPAVGMSFGQVLASVLNLMTAADPIQVFEMLAREAASYQVGAAIFEVRGKSVWGGAAAGFPHMAQGVLQGLVVPLAQNNPFEQVVGTGGPIGSSGGQMSQIGAVGDKLKPNPTGQVYLLPIRTGGSVSAILYLDALGGDLGGRVDAFQLLTAFSSAQLDRLTFIGSGADGAQVSAAPPPSMDSGGGALSVSSTSTGGPLPPDLAMLSQEDQKVHREALRFAKLLISEIELYSKADVAQGRQNKDIYLRLKWEIDRSRRTYETRFSKTVASSHDYLHDEIVRTLASFDASSLGPDYPGPTA